MAISSIALGVSAIGTGVGVVQGARAQRQQEKSDAVGRAQAEIANQREIRKAIAAGKVQRAAVSAAGQAQGAGRSSSVAGALGAAQTQSAANIGFARTTQAANDAQNAALGRARGFQASSQLFGAVAQLPTAFGFGPEASAQQIFRNRGTG